MQVAKFSTTCNFRRAAPACATLRQQGVRRGERCAATTDHVPPPDTGRLPTTETRAGSVPDAHPGSTLALLSVPWACGCKVTKGVPVPTGPLPSPAAVCGTDTSGHARSLARGNVRGRTDTFLQTQDPHGVQGVDEREAKAEPLVEGLGHRLQLVMAPGELAVPEPGVAEGVHHGLLAAVWGGWRGSRMWGPGSGQGCLSSCGPTVGSLMTHGTLSKPWAAVDSSGQQWAAVKAGAQHRRSSPQSWTWPRQRGRGAPHGGSPSAHLAWLCPPPGGPAGSTWRAEDRP